MTRVSTCLFCIAVLISALFSSCQKDDSVEKLTTTNGLSVDTAKKLSNTSSPSNYLANKGILKVKIQDSTYTFDAAQDSIAFVNIDIDGEQYYGLTAINKAHTVSFGISSSGTPAAETAGDVSGAQFLQNTAAGKKNLEYTLTHSARLRDYGILSIEKYNQQTTLAKGTFHTYMAKDSTKLKSPYVVADGTFDLEINK